MTANVKAIIFSICVVLLYTVYVELYVPPIVPAPPPSVNPVDNTVKDLKSLGELIYNGRGSCALCHGGGAERAPSLEDIFRVADLRIAEPGYNGSAKDARAYIRESMLKPSVYIVKGFALKGEPSPMKAVSLPPADLTEREVTAVIEYLSGRASR